MAVLTPEKQRAVMKELDRVTIAETAPLARPIVLAYVLGYAVGGLVALVGLDRTRLVIEQTMQEHS